MKYDKPALTYEQQAQQLIDRGLIANNPEDIIKRLKAVSYYRLTGYWYPFRNSDDSFKPNTHLDTIWRRYTFDRCLRLTALDAIERVEVSIRTKLTYTLAHRFGPFGYLSLENFDPAFRPYKHTKLLDQTHQAIFHSKETFVEHYKRKYTDEIDLPIWMATELMTFGNILTLYANLMKHDRKIISNDFAVPVAVFDSWLIALNYIRNLCAHHSRLWNRELAIKPLIPHSSIKHPYWHKPVSIPNNRIFSVLTILRYLLKQIAPQSKWHLRLYKLLDKYQDIPRNEMGFIDDWKSNPIWSE